jgi:hypothetical protein
MPRFVFARVFRRVFVLGAVILPNAEASILVTGPESAVYVAPTIYNGSFTNVLGDQSVATPTWYIAQWSNPQPLTRDILAPAGKDWVAANRTTRIRFYHAPDAGAQIPEHTYELAQTGAAPKFPLHCGTEYDLFLSATSGNIYASPSGAPAASRLAQSGPIGELTVLSMAFGLNIAEENSQRTCAINYVGYLAAVTLNSTSGLSMFYQVFLRDSRGDLFNNSSCTGYPANGTYCYSASIEYITGQGMQLPSSGRVAYDFNFLHHLVEAISLTRDPDASHWAVTGLYVGQIMQGGMTPASRWDGIVLRAY